MDPIPGGNANNYVYVLDPVNASDYSGMSMTLSLPILSGIAIYGSLQNTIAASKLQGATNRVQTTTNSSRIQGSRVITVTSRTTVTVKTVANAKIVPKVMPMADPAKIKLMAGESMVAFGLSKWQSQATFSGTIEVAGKSCVGGMAILGVSIGIGMIFSFGRAAGALNPQAFMGACEMGALGGVTTYIVTGGREIQDTSAVSDFREYLTKVF